MSFFVVSTQMSFAASGIAHAMFGGMAFALALGFNPKVGGVLAGVLMGVGVYVFGGRFPRDAVIGILFAFFMSIGAIALRFYSGYSDVLWSYMFGSVALSSVLDGVALAGFSAVTVLISGWHPLRLFLFNADIAASEGVPVGLLHMLLVALLTFGIMFSLNTFGSILTSAMVIAPALIAFSVSKGFFTSFLLSGGVSLALSLFGYALAFAFDLPFGATTGVLVSSAVGLIFVLKRVLKW